MGLREIDEKFEIMTEGIDVGKTNSIPLIIYELIEQFDFLLLASGINFTIYYKS